MSYIQTFIGHFMLNSNFHIKLHKKIFVKNMNIFHISFSHKVEV